MLHLCRVNSGMLGEQGLFCVTFTAFVALERLEARVRPNVLLQVTRGSASEVALVTLEWLFSSVHTHHVNFQFTRCNAEKLTHCASVRLFPRMGSFVILQMA